MEAEDSIGVNLSLHSKEAIIRACYSLAESTNIWMSEGADNTVQINMSRKRPTDDLPAIRLQLLNSLIDFTLREQIEKKTQKIREIIIAAALSGLNQKGDSK